MFKGECWAWGQMNGQERRDMGKGLGLSPEYYIAAKENLHAVASYGRHAAATARIFKIVFIT